MTASRLYAVLWIGWLAAFLVIEFSALFAGRPQYTLSDYVWRLERINQAWTVVRYFVAAFCIWLALHMTFGWFR